MSVLDEIQEAMRANGGGGGGLGVVFVAVVFVAAIVVAIIEIALRFLVVFPRPPFYSGQVEFRVIFPICIQERFILVLWSPLPTLAWVGPRLAVPSPSRTRAACRYGSSYRTSSGSRLSLVLLDLFKKKYLLRRELTDGDSIRLQIMSEPGGGSGGGRKSDFGHHYWQDGGTET